MKEATGELNMTVVTVVAIAAVAAFFYAFVWPNIKTSIAAQSVCANGPNYTDKDNGIECGSTNSNGQYTCNFKTEKNGRTTTQQVTCKTK